MKNLIKKILLKEDKFHELNATINFKFDLYHDRGGHTWLRKGRHGEEDRIYDIDIVELLNDAKEEIIYSIIDREITHNTRFIVSRDGGDYLNIVVHPQRLEPNHWILTTITVMKKEGFTVGKGQLQIFIGE